MFSVGPTREEVFSALFARLSTAPGIRTFSRRMMEYNEPAPQLLPSLHLWELHPETTYGGQGLPENVWEAVVAVYFQNLSKPKNGDPNTAIPGATIVNPLVDGVLQTLASDDFSTGSCTLGGLVYWCRVEGRTIIETGDTDADGRGGAMIPLKILVPSQDGV